MYMYYCAQIVFKMRWNSLNLFATLVLKACVLVHVHVYAYEAAHCESYYVHCISE